MIERRARILAVDDKPENVRLLEAVLSPAGYEVVGASNGEAALATAREQDVDLVLTDIVMPGMSGYELCRALRADERTAYLPIVTLTASGGEEKKEALEAGADDFISKPFDKTELLARVRSLLRVKRYHDDLASAVATVERQRQQLTRFFSPQIAALITSEDGAKMLEGHRRQITVAFLDLRGFTSFAETAEPEEVLGLLREYQRAMGELIVSHRGTIEHFAGDGMMVWFNDPLPVEAHELQAARMACAMRERFTELAKGWARKGYDLGFGVGIATGYATLGRIGFEGRYDYAAIGNVVILAQRLSAEAKAGQVLVSQRVHAAIADEAETEPIGELTLKGISRPVPAFDVIGVKARSLAP
jgi:adenylate cyclase